MDLELQLCEPSDPDELSDGQYDDWWVERKLDGVRAVTKNGDLHTRSGRSVTNQFPDIDPPDDLVLDGELVTHDMDFGSIMSRVQTEDEFKIELLSKRKPAILVVFDCLEDSGTDLRDIPLRKRREHVPEEMRSNGLQRISTYDDPSELWQRATDNGWEGVVVKDPESEYVGDRVDTWRKFKCWEEGVFDVVGFEETVGDKGDKGFVVLVDIGTDDPQKVVVNGHDDRDTIQRGVDQVEIQYLERTDSGRLRKPSFKRVYE